MNVSANSDGTVTFSWANPPSMPGGPSKVTIPRVYVETTEDSGDGFGDLLLQASLSSSDTTYTIPASEVTRLKGQTNLTWYVQIRQRVFNVTNPDSSTNHYYIYRNYGPRQTLNLP